MLTETWQCCDCWLHPLNIVGSGKVSSRCLGRLEHPNLSVINTYFSPPWFTTHGATAVESMFYPEPLTEPCVTKPARMSDFMLEEIVICVLRVCHFAAFLKTFCVLSHKHVHKENKASPDSFSVPGSITQLWGSLQAGGELWVPGRSGELQ